MFKVILENTNKITTYFAETIKKSSTIDIDIQKIIHNKTSQSFAETVTHTLGNIPQSGYKFVLDFQPIIMYMSSWLQWFNITYLPIILLLLLKSYCFVESSVRYITNYSYIFIVIMYFKVYVNKNNTLALKEASNLFFNFVIVVLIEILMKYSGSLLFLGVIIYIIYLFRHIMTDDFKNNLDQDVEDARRGRYINIWHRGLCYATSIFNVHHIVFISQRLFPIILRQLASSCPGCAIIHIIVLMIILFVTRKIIKCVVDVRIDSVFLAMICLVLHIYQIQHVDFL